MLALLFPILVDIYGGGVCAIIIISAACVCVFIWSIPFHMQGLCHGHRSVVVPHYNTRVVQ